MHFPHPHIKAPQNIYAMFFFQNLLVIDRVIIRLRTSHSNRVRDKKPDYLLMLMYMMMLMLMMMLSRATMAMKMMPSVTK